MRKGNRDYTTAGQVYGQGEEWIAEIDRGLRLAVYPTECDARVASSMKAPDDQNSIPPNEVVEDVGKMLYRGSPNLT